MPQFEFHSPEGKTYTVNGPEGATSAQAFQMLQGQIGKQPEQSSTSGVSPESIGQKIGGGVKSFLGGMNVPLWNAIGTVPIPAVQRFAKKEAGIAANQGNSPTLSQLGEGTTQAGAMLIGGPEMAGAKLLPRIAADASMSGIQSGLTAPVGGKSDATLMGAALGAGGSGLSKSLSALGRGLAAGKPQTQAVADSIKEAENAGYQLQPGKALGFSKAGEGLINPGAGNAAQHNYDVYEAKLADLMGMPKGEKIDRATLAKANSDIVDRFNAVLGSKNVKIPSDVAQAVQSLIVKQPAIAEALVRVPGLAESLEKAQLGAEVPAKQWFAALRQLKNMRYSTQEPNLKAQLGSVINSLESPVLATHPDIAKAYNTFNGQYRTNALLLDTVKNSPAFLQQGKIDPRLLWLSVANDARTAGGQARNMISDDPLIKTARTASELNLIPHAEDENANQALNAMTAGMHAAGLPVHLSVSSANVLPKMASHFGIGKTARSLYGTEGGQRLLAGGQFLSPENAALLANLRRTTAGEIGAAAPPTPGEQP